MPPAPERNPILRFADFFIDGCDVRLLQGVDCHTQAALPDGSLVDLGTIFRGKQRPAEFGATYVLHSATKFLGGHGDVIAGVVCCDEARAAPLRTVRAATGVRAAGTWWPAAADLA